MTFDEFTPIFQQLVNAFHVSGADKKIDVYYKHLKKLPFETFQKVTHKCEGELERFPTIAKIFEIASAISPPVARKSQECDECDGFGTVSLWKHTFRGRCIHGEQVSKKISLVPITTEEKTITYERLNREWNEVFVEDLKWKEFETSTEGLDPIQKAKVIFDIAHAPFADVVRQQIKHYSPEKFVRMMKQLRSLEAIQNKQGRLYDYWVKWWQIGFEIHGKEELLKLYKKEVH